MTETEKASYLNTSGPYQGPEQEIIDYISEKIGSYKKHESSLQSIKDLTADITVGIAKMASKYKSKNGVSLTGNSKGAGGEWMFDVVWYATEYKDGQPFTTEFVLACESELSDTTIGGIQIDFDKLLLANCHYRIFLCRAEQHYQQPENVNNRITYFNNAVASCQNLRPGDRVLVLIWDDWKTGAVFPHLIVKQ